MDQQGGAKLKHYTCVMDSMTEKELDSDSNFFKTQPSRIYRLARGSGVTVQEIQELIMQQEAVLTIDVDGQDGEANGWSKWSFE
jgi:signal recognition particle subunit SRP54